MMSIEEGITGENSRRKSMVMQLQKEKWKIIP